MKKVTIELFEDQRIEMKTINVHDIEALGWLRLHEEVLRIRILEEHKKREKELIQKNKKKVNKKKN